MAWMRLKDHVSSWKAHLARCKQHGRWLAFPSNPSPKRKSKSGIFWAAHLLTSTGPHGSRLWCTASKEATKTRKLRGSSQGLFRTQHKVCTWKQSLVMKVNLLFVHFHTISYSPSSLYCWSQLSQGARLKFVVCEVPKESTFLPGCFWTAWNNTGSVAQ